MCSGTCGSCGRGASGLHPDICIGKTTMQCCSHAHGSHMAHARRGL
nr:MAG TPA: hypothetical protein [Caudoviricetes sp.]